MAEGMLSKGIALSYAASAPTTTASDFTVLQNLQEIPDFGSGDADTVETTTLAHSTRTYIKGLKDVGDGLEFTFLYTSNSDADSSFRVLKGIEEADTSNFYVLSFPDGTIGYFKGKVSVSINGAGAGDALQFTANIVPASDITIAFGATLAFKKGQTSQSALDEETTTINIELAS